MKKINIYRFLTVIVASAMIFSSCTKEMSEVRLDPKLSTSSELKELTSNAVTVIGFVVAQGDGFAERGVCYKLAANPTIADNKVIFDRDVSGATFDVRLTDLDYATTYYAKAYAINETDTLYGKEITFTTLPILPTISTVAISEIKGISAIGGGNITNAGGANVTARGIVFAITANPTVADTISKTVDGIGTGAFISEMKGLTGVTTYYVRAYAINSVGISYGEQVEFTTTVDTRTWNIPGDYVEGSYPGSVLANWAPENSPQIKSISSAPDDVEGYVYMANATNEWKIASQPSWDGPNYGNGGSGTLSESGGNMASPAGYYKLNVNAGVTPMTFTAVATVWGVIGDATPNTWNDETALVYDPASKTWRGVVHLTAAQFKFRANHNWDYNYGSTAANEKLNVGGENIAISVESDYAIALDLSKPLDYTYAANRWGIIGDAQGNWDIDKNMTWDNTTKVFTITLDLVSSGFFKFRANDAWDVSYGGELGALTAGGTNLSVATDGNYTVTFDPWGLKATVTKN